MPAHTAPTTSVGEAFAQALARKDFLEVGTLLHQDVDFKALTPGRAWEPANHGEVMETLQMWFGNCEVEDVSRLETDMVSDCHRVAYRFRGQRPKGPFVIEQQAYFTETEGQIDSMRITCTGFQAR
jgi:hypothetical protein